MTENTKGKKHERRHTKTNSIQKSKTPPPRAFRAGNLRARAPRVLREHPRDDSAQKYGGGYEQDASAEGGSTQAGGADSGTLTVRVRRAGGAARHASPSSAPNFAYAALLYPDGGTSSEFVSGEADGSAVTFLFERPADTTSLVLELFAFAEGTTDFSRTDALLGGQCGVTLRDDEKSITVDAIPLKAIAGKEGFVSLKVTAPDGYLLDIDDEHKDKFTVTGTSLDFTIGHSGDGIPAGSYPITLTLKKGEKKVLAIPDSINVLPGMTTDTWGGLAPGEARTLSEGTTSKVFYVRGSGEGWYSANGYSSYTASDDEPSSGSFLVPFATIQAAIDKVKEVNDGESEYTIYVDGKLTLEASVSYGMARISGFTKNISLTIKSLSATDKATLDADKKSSVMYIKQESGTSLSLTLENLVMTGGTSSGVYIYGGDIFLKECEITGNTVSSLYGGGICVQSNGNLTMEGGTISGNLRNNYYGGGVCVYDSVFIMNGGKIFGNKANNGYGGGVYLKNGTFEMNGGTIGGDTEEEGNTGEYGAGVFVENSTFWMNGGRISRNKASGTNACGGGVCLYDAESTFEMIDGEISGNSSTRYAGGVAVRTGSFTMKNSTIIGNDAGAWGGGVYVSGGSFTMENGEISGNDAGSCGGGGYVYNCSFTMRGGKIGGNTVGDDTTDGYGDGLYLGGTLIMSDSAQILEDDWIYYSSNALIKLSGAPTYSDKIAKIYLESSSSYFTGRTVLGGADFTLTPEICNRFEVKPDSDGKEWKVKLDSANNAGVLQNTILYVKGGGATWYPANGYADIDGDDRHSGGLLRPLARVQEAIENIIDMNDGTSEYTIYVDGTISNFLTSTTPIVSFADLDKSLKLRIMGMDENQKATLNANECNAKVIDATVSSRGTLMLSFENLTITGANSKSGNGGGIFVSLYNSRGFVSVSNCEIKDNKSTGRGGGIYLSNGTLNMKNTTISGNSADGSGGGVYVSTSGIFTMDSCIISDNESTASLADGGGIYIDGGTFTMNGGAVKDNKASTEGGGVRLVGGTFIMNGGEISGNSMTSTSSDDNKGGGVYINDGGTFTMEDGTISDNKAIGDGGGIYLSGGTFTMNNGKIVSNSSGRSGGGVYINNGCKFIINDGEITGNTATRSSNGVYKWYDNTYTKNGGTVQDD